MKLVRTTSITILSTIAGLLCIVSACKKRESASSNTHYSLEQFTYSLSGAPKFVNDRFDAISSEKAQLGRALFYDKSLSLNGSISCGSCHIQKLGFADGKAVSTGFVNGQTRFNSMTLVNSGSQSRYFWNGRAGNLKTQVLMPISDHIEMGLDNEKLLEAKVAGSPMYRDLFARAFADKTISSKKIGEAIAHFVASIVSYNSKYDQVQRKEAVFSSLEQQGKKLFETKYRCASCHGGENFSSPWGGSDFANIGLDLKSDTSTFTKNGFKVPSLRNVEVTAPYMHDGRLKTLEDVINHYSHGMKKGAPVDWRLSPFVASGGMKITKGESQALIAFMKTLTDHQLLNDPKFSDPF